MRVAIVSDIHGNRTAFEAVLADLRVTAPDLVLHGGDLADAGSSPVEIVDRIRDLGWQGVMGNTDEMLARPESLAQFAEHTPGFAPWRAMVERMALATRDALGDERLAWLRALPRAHVHDALALVHASSDDAWRSPTPESDDAAFMSAYAPLGKSLAVYGHIHRPFVRRVADMIVANAGSVSLSYDGDRRASYLLVDDGVPSVRRVEYDVEREIESLCTCGLPHSDWVAKILSSGKLAMP
jgi:predicted phosphodiesterase